MVIIGLSLFFILLLVITLFCYKQSDRILIRKSKYTPLTIFPSQFNAPFEEVSFTNRDNMQLKGWFIPALKKSDKTIIFLHGWGQNKGEILSNTIFLREKGFNLFYFDFRGSGESAQGRSSIGYLEAQDAICALDYILDSHPEETKHIGVYGLSMGAAVAIYLAAHRREVACVIAEACYFSYEKVVARWARLHKKAPYFPLVPLTLFFARKRLGFNPEDYSPKNNIKRLARNKKPILIITGTLDSLAPSKDAKALFLGTNYPKQIWLVEGAKHTECAQVAGTEYQERLGEFYTKYLSL